jgi:rod shape-determining protein MreC
VVLLALLALGTIMVVLSHRPATTKPEQVGRRAFGALQSALHDVGGFFGGSWNAIAELRRMRLELTSARQRLLELEQLSSDLAELERQYAELRRQLAFAARTPYRAVSAEVTARDPGSLFTTLTINRGTRHGVRVGMSVVALQDGLQGLVGRVAEADGATSLVQPISARASFVAARLQELRYDGLVQGRGSGTSALLMRHVNSAARDQIVPGELIITSGLGGVFPRGLQIGRVREVRAETFQNSLDLLVEPLIDVSRLEYVFVIIPEAS